MPKNNSLPTPLDFQFYPPEKLKTEELPAYLLDSRMKQVHDWLISGISQGELSALILEEKYPDIGTRADAEKLIGYVLENALFQEQQDKEYVFELHMKRYEEMYSREIELKSYQGFDLATSDHEHHPIIAAKLNAAMELLKAKEELLGLHDKSFIVEIQNNFNGNDSTSAVSTDHICLDSLPIEEQMEMLKLIRLARKNAEDGVQPIMIDAPQQEEPETEAEVIEEAAESIEPVVDKFQTEKTGDDRDDIDKLKDGAKTIREVKKDIEKSNLDLFKKIIKSKKS